MSLTVGEFTAMREYHEAMQAGNHDQAWDILNSEDLKPFPNPYRDKAEMIAAYTAPID